MSEAAVIEAPAAAPAPANIPAAPAPVAPEPVGIAKMMAELDAATTPKKAEPAKPDPGVKTPEAAKPDPAKPKEEPARTALSWDKAPEKFRKAHEESAKELEARDKKISEYEARIKAIESKKVETPADTKLIEEYQGRIKALETDLAHSAYERSPEFKRNYVDKWNSTYKAAVAEISTLLAGEGSGDERKERQANEADFRNILRLEPKDQGPAARRLFGDSADLVLTHRNELNRIKREGEEALGRARESHDTKSKEQELATKKQQETYENSKRAAEQELQTKWPQFFGDDPADEEVTKALQGGREFVRGAIAKMAEAPAEERAAYAAVIEARAAAYPRVVLEKKRADDKVAALEAELSKYRKSDPGAVTDVGGGGKPAEGSEAGEGIEAMSKKFDQ